MPPPGQEFKAALAQAGFAFADLKFVVGDVIDKKDGGDFVGEMTDAGEGRYGVYLPGTNGKPAFARNFLLKSDVKLVVDRAGKHRLKATLGEFSEEV